MCINHLRPLLATRNQYMFHQIAENKLSTVVLGRTEKLDTNFYFFFKQDPNQSFVYITFYGVCTNKPLLYMREKVLSNQNPDK